MTVINTNTAATITANALTKNERAMSSGDGASVYRPAHQLCRR